MRGMAIAADYRGQGIGEHMLRTLEMRIDGQDCYCLAWALLEHLYRLVGFGPIGNGEIPTSWPTC